MIRCYLCITEMELCLRVEGWVKRVKGIKKYKTLVIKRVTGM